jgi:hypothetical protein
MVGSLLIATGHPPPTGGWFFTYRLLASHLRDEYRVPLSRHPPVPTSALLSLCRRPQLGQQLLEDDGCDRLDEMAAVRNSASNFSRTTGR